MAPYLVLMCVWLSVLRSTPPLVKFICFLVLVDKKKGVNNTHDIAALK